MTTYAETGTNGAPAAEGYTTADARVDLAAAHRLVARADLHEGTWNHISLTDPEDPSAILISPSYVHWSQVTASSLERLGSDQEAAKRDEALWVAYRIHYPLHQARPDARCVLHVHSPNIVALSMLGVGINGAEQNALMFHDKVSYTPEYDGLWPNDLEHGRRMAEALGPKNIVLMLRSHGAVVIGKSVGEAYTRVYVLERAAKFQILAMSTGLPLLELSESELDRLSSKEPVALHSDGNFWHDNFTAMKRVLDREEPDYRD